MGGNSAALSDKKKLAKDSQLVEMTIKGKKLCASCEDKISASVSGIDGVAGVSFDRKRGVAIIELKVGAKADFPTLVSAVKNAGFDVEIPAAKSNGS